MDCKNARLLLEFIRPGGANLDADEAEAVEQHLADCPDCGLFASDERRADDHLGRAMRAVPIPSGLRERILQNLPPPRLPWHRRWPWRSLGGGAAAAILLLAVGLLAYRHWVGPPPAVDVNLVYEQANRQFLSRREAVEKDFKENLGVTMRAPPQFNYNLLDSYGLVAFQGQQVPQLLFFAPRDEKNPAGLARVYVLSSRQFDLEQTRKNWLTTPSNSRMVKLEEHPEGDRDYLYLVVYSGHSLEPFFPKLGAF